MNLNSTYEVVVVVVVVRCTVFCWLTSTSDSQSF